jgi:hypothetical protein
MKFVLHTKHEDELQERQFVARVVHGEQLEVLVL